MGAWACHVRYAVVVILLILVIVFLSKWSGGNNTVVVAGSSESQQDLIRLANEWATKSNEDENPVGSLINASYAVAYLDAAKKLGFSGNTQDMTNALQQKQLENTQRIYQSTQ